MTSHDARPDLILHNARVVTLDERKPAAELVAVRDGRIVWVGVGADLPNLGSRGARVLDCGGRALLPGFIDAHCHLFAYAASRVAVDCSPPAVGSISDLKDTIRRRALNTPSGAWIRAAGYNEFDLAEGRHPTRWDLDEAAPLHPVKLDHRSGHASVLNSLALERVGILSQTDEPPGGTIERDRDTGEPNGLLLEMADYLGGRIPPLDDAEFDAAVRKANARLLAYGVTSIQDATPSNSTESWDTLGRLTAEGIIDVRTMMMPGVDHLDAFVDRGLGFASGDEQLSLGHGKLMTTLSSGALVPSWQALESQVVQAHDAGFPVAIHAVEAKAVEAAAAAIGAAGKAGIRDRIEHCSECPPDTLALLLRSAATVVTQPAFLYHSGRRYLAEVDEDVQPWLYRIRSLLDSGVVTAASSDAPVTAPNPLVGVYAAVNRRAESGEVVGEGEAVSVHVALRMYGPNAAYAAGQEADRGSIEVGKLADMVLLNDDPTTVNAEELLSIRPVMTLIGGRIAWEA